MSYRAQGISATTLTELSRITVTLVEKDNMSEQRGRGFGGRRGGPRRGPRRGGRRDGKDVWVPATKLGRLAHAGKLSSIEEIYAHSLPIKEVQIIDALLPGLKDEVMKIKPVQKQTTAGQRTRFRAVVIVGDSNGHVGLGTKTSSEVAMAIRSAINIAKLNVIPVRRGYWGSRIGLPHSVASKVTGKCGSVTVRLVPAPRGKGIVASPGVAKMLEFAGVQDVFTQSVGSTRTLENTLKALFAALGNTYAFMTPDLWADGPLNLSPLEVHYVEAAPKTR